MTTELLIGMLGDLILVIGSYQIIRFCWNFVRRKIFKIQDKPKKEKTDSPPADEQLQTATLMVMPISTTWSVISIIAFFILTIALLGGDFDAQVEKDLQEIRDKVALDAVEQYHIARKHGGAIDRCTQAGLVTAALLQAKDEKHYQEWKKVEKAECARAGL